MKPIRSILAGLGLILLMSAAGAETPPAPVTLDIKAQPMADALNQWAQQTGFQLIFPEEQTTAGLVSSGVRGTLTPRAALARLLENSGLTYAYVNERTVQIRPQSNKSVPTPALTEKASNDAPTTQMLLAQSQASAVHETEDSKTAAKEEQKSDSMVVTGSRIAIAASQLAANVVSLSAEDLRATGESTLEKALRLLPQNMLGSTEVGVAAPGGGMSFNGALNITGGSSINLRGLGSESTLVLVDGRRIGKSGVFGGASDISGIPMSSVERVDIMLDGASSVYGSDAVGGVVNIILRKEYSGAEATVEYGVPRQGGFDESIFTLSGGKSWESTRLRASFEHFKNTNLDASDRPDRIYSERWDTPGGIQANGGLFYTYNGQNYRASQLAGLGLTTTSPGVRRITYSQVPAGTTGIGLTLNSFAPLGSRNLAADSTNLGPEYNDDQRAGLSLIPQIKRDSVQLGFDRDFQLFGSDTTFSGNLYYSDRSTHAGSGAFRVAYNLPAANPNNPFGVTARIFWIIPSLGDTHFATDQEVRRGNLSLTGRFGDSSWRWTLAGSSAHDRIDSMNYNLANVPPSNTTINFLAGDIVAANTPAQLASLVKAPQAIAAINEETMGELNASGALFAMPGGDAHLAAGVEWREESLTSSAEATTIAQTAGNFNASMPQLPYNADISRTQRSAFAELMLPIVGRNNAVAGIRQLMLTGSGRHDSYGTYGSSNTWSAGVIYSPLEQLRFKANHSTSFVAPTPREGLAATDRFEFGPGDFPQPIFNAFGVQVGEEYIGEFVLGGNRDLGPETAASWSAGVELRPALIPGLVFDATWHETSYRDRITEAPAPQLIQGVDYVGIYPNIDRRPDGLLYWDARAINAASVEISGIDLQTSYSLQTQLGEFVVAGNIGYTGKYDQVTFAGQPAQNRVGDVSGGGNYVYQAVPKYRYASSLRWYRGGWSATVDGTSASDIRVRYFGGGQNLITISRTPVIANLLLSYDWDAAGPRDAAGWFSGARVTFKVVNVFEDNRSTTQYVVETGQRFSAWYNANYADPRGRMFHVSLTKRF